MIEANLHDELPPRRNFGDVTKLVDVSSGGFLDHDVPPFLQGGDGQLRELIVRRGHDDGVDFRADRFPPIVDRGGTGPAGQDFGARPITIANNHQLMAAGGVCPLGPNEAASDDREPHYVLSQPLPRSDGVIRRSVYISDPPMSCLIAASNGHGSHCAAMSRPVSPSLAAEAR